ncbi:MAG TPA: type 1 glutamine amidotransferase [Candidatus Polarisedimenticolia bacterium]|nr:type 1 glutamine amidotransferase [Candidatus Polarisedimenticolia bacterium]
MNIHCIQHVRYERPGSIARWAKARGHLLERTCLGDGVPVPTADSFDALVIMGGPMSVGDEAAHPWLTPEKKLIETVIRHGKPLVGICLGAQLVASVLGAPVTRAPAPEIGWFPIRRAPGAERIAAGAAIPESMAAFHWHQDTFDLPPEAVLLASSDACPNQAFAWGARIVGLQFHLEISGDIAQDMIRNAGESLREGPTVQQAHQMLWEPARFDRSNQVLEQILDTIVK